MLVNSITAQIRALGALACFSCAALGCSFEPGDHTEQGADSVSQGLATDIAVYTDSSLASGWQSWSWSSTVTLASTDTPLASTGTSEIKTVSRAAGGALALAHTASDLTTSDYDSLSFDIRGTATSSVRLQIETLAGGGGGTSATIPVTTSWSRQIVKLSALQGSLGTFGKIDWVSALASQTFYVDNVKLVAKATASAPAPAPPATTAPPASATYPSAPLTVTKGNVVTLSTSYGSYALYVPTTYDATHHTPTKLLLWMHGCGGVASGDAWETSPGGSQDWVSVSVGGRDGDCWDVNGDTPMVLAALDDVKKRLNVDPHRVVIGGYSSGGDMAYRIAFYNTKRFAGLIVENTSPFRDTGSSESSSLAAASWKLNIVHLAHLSDMTYPIGPVRTETDAVKAAGFPLTRLEHAGTHSDPETSTSGTDHDMRTYLLPYLDAGWVSPN